MKKIYIFLLLLFSISCKHPFLYQISTRPWLYELSKKYGQNISKLVDIPLEEFDILEGNGVEIVWMMGVWQLGEYGPEFDKKGNYDEVLPDWTPDDVIGSPFAITEYTCNSEIGTDEDLKWLREEIHKRGMKLMLDFVPNHSAADCPFVDTDRDMYIRAPEGVVDETRYNEKGIAYGSDSNHYAWRDVVQWNYWENKTIEEMKNNLVKVMTIADAVRCDVAYLVINDVFESSWEEELSAYGYKRPEREFWSYAIEEAKKVNEDGLFLAESYDDRLSQKLIELGFDYVYDKVLLDKLILKRDDVVDFIKDKTSANWDHACHFVENHDEQRIVFMTQGNYEKAMAAGTIAATVGGMIFINHGQWEGKKNKLDVHLRRATDEEDNIVVKRYYTKLNQILRDPAFRSSNYYYIDNMTGEKREDFIAYLKEEGDNHYLVVVNYSEKNGCANVPIHNIKGYRYCLLHEALNDVEYVKTIKEVQSGFQVCLNAWETHIFQYNY